MSFALALQNLDERSWQPQRLPEPMPIDELPTPALLINEKLLDANLAKMANHLATHSKGFRPHTKTHKCPVIAHKQLAAGAVGICTAKLAEAYVMAKAGVSPILITSPLATPSKIRVLAELSGEVDGLAVVVDQVDNLEMIVAALPDDAHLGIVVDIDVAMGRTGTRALDTVLRLAKIASETRGLVFLGVQHYAGHLMHVHDYSERRDRSLELWQSVDAQLQQLSAAGTPATIVTGGGTGTYNIDCDVDVVTDLQVGSYVFMDQEYRDIGGRDRDQFDDFDIALTLAATGISQPRPGRAFTVDAGYKSFASDSVAPVPVDLPGAKFVFGGDEHGIVLLSKDRPVDAAVSNSYVGSVHQFVTPHCDPTVNLHDFYYVHDGEMVFEAWPITARGCSW